MWVIYTKPGCVYCTKATALLRERGEHFEVIQPDTRGIQRIKAETGHGTFPFIFDGEGVFLGGYTELERLFEF